ncbi:hypothetical protein HMPREF9075_00560 [Capnocytophaga sp. oral taxon 332 str. F0381]|nr:hypothetical protein HMPREF9075_00560 [Capnocytophaga sp. oral taxon 332 str. F0381]
MVLNVLMKNSIKVKFAIFFANSLITNLLICYFLLSLLQN